MFRKQPKRSAEEIELENQARLLREKKAKIAEYIEEAPKRKRLAQNTLPPLVDLDRRRAKRRFQTKLTHGSLRNEKREFGKNTFMVVLLVVAIIAVLAWIIRFFQ